MSDDPGPIKRGDRITAKYLNTLRKWIIAGTKLAVEAPLSMLSIAGWKSIRIGLSRPMYARLLGVSSGSRAYSWAEVEHISGINWQLLAGGRSGTSNAYESNLAIDVPVGGSGGAVVELMPGFGGSDWRFQWQRIGGPTPTPCSTAQSITLCLSVACCWTLGPETITITRVSDGSTVATCTTSNTFISCYNGSASIQGCSIDLTSVGRGVLLQWSFTDATFGAFSGTFTTTCGPSYALVDLWTVDSLADTLHVTDPDGNMVPISRQGPVGTFGGRQWLGTHTYSRIDSKGGTHGFTLQYLWQSCILTVTIIAFDGFTPPQAPWNSVSMSLSCFAIQNICSGQAGPPYPLAAFLALTDWVPPTDVISLVPLDILYSQYTNQLTYLGQPPTTIKAFGCGCNDGFHALSGPFGGQLGPLANGAYWQMFGCPINFILTS